MDADGLRGEFRHALATGFVNPRAEAVVGNVHFVQTGQNLRRAGVEMIGDKLLQCSDGRLYLGVSVERPRSRPSAAKHCIRSSGLPAEPSCSRLWYS